MPNPIRAFKESINQIPTKYRFWTSLGILAALLIALPITMIGLMTGTFELRRRAVTAEPTPPMHIGAFDLEITNPNRRKVCQLGDTDCFYLSGVTITNRTDQPLYNSTIYQSSPNEIMSFLGFNKEWVSTPSTTDQVIQPGEQIRTMVKVTPPNSVGTWYAHFLVDGKTCNLKVDPPDCYFYGASSFTVIIEVVEESAPTDNPISWSTDNAQLRAEGFYILAGSQSFNASPGGVSISSDPGNYYYTTLESTWRENNREMRLFMYFGGDEDEWWVDEIRTYNGQEHGDWIYYQGPFFKSPRGTAFQGTELLLEPTSPSANAGMIYLSNFIVQPFFRNEFPSCGRSCSSDSQCGRGLACGTPCPEGQVCAQFTRCYNPNCPYDRDCICGAIPTAVPCTPEGQSMAVYPGNSCCPGLEAISTAQPDNNGNCPEYPPLGASICVKNCGDGQCTLGENKCNCPEDCQEELPTLTPPPSTLTLKLRFRGVTSRPPNDSNQKVKIYATNLTGGPDLASENDKLELPIRVDDSGVYSVEFSLDGAYFGHRYRLRIKGPKHLQSVFPNVFFQAGGELNLTEWELRPGDLDQDGDVDINDLRGVKVFSTDPTAIAFGDVNFDGKLGVLDRILILNTLSVQYDPN